MSRLLSHEALGDDGGTTTTTSVVDLRPTAPRLSLEQPTLLPSDARRHALQDRAPVAMPTSVTPGHQSKASTFLTRLLESSRSMPPVYEGKVMPVAAAQPTPIASTSANASASASASSSASGSASASETSPLPQDLVNDVRVPVRRRQSIVITGSDAQMHRVAPLQHRKTMPDLFPHPHQSVQRIGSGMNHLTAREEETEEYVTEAELHARPLRQLVRDLSLYKKKKSGTLLRILHQIQWRLHDAEIESSTHRASHVDLCRDLVDDGILSGIVLVLREFRFHVALQIAAVTLLTFLADVSDLYAYMMAELDVELLVKKIVAVHVSQERLVMNGSSLIHTISESKHKPHVVKMHKAHQIEQEKKRAASFVEAFAAERRLSRVRGAEERYGIPTSPDNPERKHSFFSVSRWQRSASRGLGVPPVLTSHYDLKTSLPRSPSILIPPLERHESGNKEARTQSHEEADWIRPKTSPDPRHFAKSCSSEKLAAVYLASPTFVTCSPMGKRVKAKRTSQSAFASNRRMLKKKTNDNVLVLRDTTVTPTDNGSVSTRRDEVGADSKDLCLRDQATCQVATSLSIETGELQSGRRSEDDANYYDDDFADDDEGDGNQGNSFAGGNQERLLPVGSDSDLIELVDQSRAEMCTNLSIDDEEAPSSATISGELSAGDDSGVTAHSTCLSAPSSTDAVTNELVGLLESCVRPKDPTDSSKVTRPAELECNRSEKSVSSHSRAPGSWKSSNAIVRPVSRRILEKTAKTMRRQHVPRSSTPCASTPIDPNVVQHTAQIATMLDEVRGLTDTAGVCAETDTTGSSTNAIAGIVYSPPEASTPTTSVAQIQALYARGLQHHKASELDAAVRCYEEGIHLRHSSGIQREFASLYINLGSARMAQQRPYDALVAFTQAERIQPSNSKAKFNSGLVLMQLAQWEEAVAKFELVVAADPSHVRAQCALAQCRKAAKQSQKAS